MCIICTKPRGLALPSTAILTRMFQGNRDGFGLAYHHKGDKHVTILKGAMTAPEASRLIAKIPKPTQANVLLHFRIATEGKVCPENCHPFPLSAKDYYLKATSLLTPVAIAHNGMVTVKGLIEKQFIKRERQFSDTQKFIKHFFAGMGMAIFNKQITKLIDEYVGGKFAFLTPQGFHFIGEFHEKEGLSYSHLGFTFDYTNLPRSRYRPPVWIAQECDLCNVRGVTLELSDGVYACKYCFQQLGLPLYDFAVGTSLPCQEGQGQFAHSYSGYEGMGY